MTKYVGSIDQGTTSSRFIVFDRKGDIVALDQKEHAQIYPKPGWVEHDATEIWRNTQAVIAGALQKAGLSILARNWRCRAGEIDILAREGEAVVVVEVKTRRGRQAGTPEQGVDDPKRRKLCALAQAYVDATGWEGPVRIDVVAVELDSAGHLLRLSHWRDAFDCW